MKELKTTNSEQFYKIKSFEKHEYELSVDIIKYKKRIENLKNLNEEIRLEKEIASKEKLKISNDMEYLKTRIEDSKTMQNTLIQSLTHNIADN